MDILVKTPELINIRHFNTHAGHKLPSNTLKIDRSTKWGNPFVITPEQSREDVIEKHKEWFLNGDGSYLQKDIMELLDYDFVACWCTPFRCHWENYWDYLLEELQEMDMIDE